MNDIILLVRSTAHIYGKSFVNAGKISLASWKCILVQILGLIIFAILTFLVSIIFSGGGILPSLVLGLLLAYFLAGYLSLVRYGIENENISRESLLHDTNMLFSSVISALFTFFVIRFTIDFLQQPFLSAAVGILLAVLLNPLPEVVYFRGGSVSETFTESFEFVRDNFIEWFFIPVVLFLVIFGLSPNDFFEFFSVNPLYQVELLLFKLSRSALSPITYFHLFLILVALYFVMIFRGLLFKELRMGRRARLYRARQ
jgi:hypothetical protein